MSRPVGTVAAETPAVDAFALGAAVLALSLWSGTTPANKIAVAHIDALTVGLLRSGLAGVLALATVAALRLPPPAGARQVALLLLSGLTSFAVWPAMLSIGVRFTSAGHAGLVMALIPVMTVLFGHLQQRRLPGARWWFGALVALAATVILMSGRGVSFTPIEGGPGWLGDLIVLAGCAFCAVGYVAGGRLAARLGALATTLWGLVAAMFVSLPVVAWLAPATDWAAVPRAGWLAVAYMTVLSSLVGYGLWFFALGRGGVQRIGSLQLAMPATTLAVALLLLGERLNPWSALSAALLIGGTVIAHRHA